MIGSMGKNKEAAVHYGRQPKHTWPAGIRQLTHGSPTGHAAPGVTMGAPTGAPFSVYSGKCGRSLLLTTPVSSLLTNSGSCLGGLGRQVLVHCGASPGLRRRLELKPRPGRYCVMCTGRAVLFIQSCFLKWLLAQYARMFYIKEICSACY